MSKLITQSLISSIEWFNICPTSWRDKAYKDLKNLLSRIWTTPGKAVQRGIDFEKAVYNVLNSKKDIDTLKCSKEFKKVLKLCEGGKFQTKNKSYITVNKQKYCLYGKEDVTFPDTIKDIKTTYKYKEDKYKKSFQHKIYLHNTQKRKFDYIVVIFEDEYSNKISCVEVIKIRAYENMLKGYKGEIINKICEIELFLEKYPELQKLYITKYNRY